MSDPFTIRPAVRAGAPIIARHRAEMFADMGQLPPHLYAELVAQTISYLDEALPRREYLGWLASATGQPEVVAGAGVQLRRSLPHALTNESPNRIAFSRQGIVLNVFTEKAWRRRGLAAMLMRHVLEWAARSNLDTLVLHASGEGRSLYDRLGFVPTNEMRYARALR
jgi:GNAT superfamily N-acetyltransferase